MFVEADEGLALDGDLDRADLVGVHGPGRLAQGVAGGAPPVLGVLLAPAGLGDERKVARPSATALPCMSQTTALVAVVEQSMPMT